MCILSDIRKWCIFAIYSLILLNILSDNIVVGGKSSLSEKKTSMNESLYRNHEPFDNQMPLSDEVKSTNSKTLRRDKRYLIFGGISKLVLGILTPVETRDNVNWRTLNMAYNIQAQYQALPRIVWPWDRFSRSLDKQRKKFDEDGTFVPDGTRDFVYNALELFMERKGKNGKQCLLKAICEVALHPIHFGGVFDEVIHLVLTPNKKEVHDDYLDAKNAGLFGADCLSLYDKCPPGSGLLDGISFYF